ncbi:bifunctional 5,10-methylenetetrahydrofolate dehydrogenase/5,10-methenyltetrahydrofolate cyclohydrolase [Lapidilactobacillus luobeiensis]|uniref:bifunctional 5,10-methylenetetrahydrofolate dehydrogenase/5,10-methenyltetrahydrofolate cyclohydrolase n=1 Tax=Lapidilactobacillus luobeiensis TaxID=2950371 RepID=UPI0021C3D8C5|nr:tetrahydrofolate dehydrogenase/cyclohydrolase catalytic domain-containing protein [Lapidilactobacillus luobeiensis]
MTATLLDGKTSARAWRAATAARVERLRMKKIVPGLAVVLVGHDPASEIYVRNKARQAEKVGIVSTVRRLAESATQAEVLATVAKLNQDQEIDGILVQLPLPPHLNEAEILLAVDPAKDVDGFHPYNLGQLWSGRPNLVPATAAGIMKLLADHQLSVAGKNAVVLGRSLIVGRPVAGLLLAADATVTIAHSHTANVQTLCAQADLLIAAVGQADFVTADFVKPGAIVIDVGTNRVAGHLVGDVAPAVATRAGYLTPVPGGVGPMTIAALLSQTVDLAEGRVYHG